MKKLLGFFVFLILINASCALAQEDSSWDKYEADYKENVIDDPVTQKEFEQALQDYKKAIDKKNKSWWKKKKPKVKEDDVIKYEYASSKLPLLRIYSPICVNNRKIDTGFYSAKVFSSGKRYFLSLFQTTTNEVLFEVFPASFSKGKQFAKISKYDENFAKLEYQNLEYNFQTFLPYCR